MAQGIQVYIGASVADLISGLKDGTTAIRNFGREAQGARPAIEQASGGFQSLTRDLFAFKREQVAQGRLVGFYVRELLEFTSVTKEAQGVVAGLGNILVEGLAGGLGVGVAIEGVKLLAIAFREWGSEAREAAEKAARGMEEFQKSLVKSRNELQHQTFLAMGGTENQWMAMQAQGQTFDRLQMLQAQERAEATRLKDVEEQLARARAQHNDVRVRHLEVERAGLQNIRDQIEAIHRQNDELMRNANLIDAIDRAKTREATEGRSAGRTGGNTGAEVAAANAARTVEWIAEQEAAQRAREAELEAQLMAARAAADQRSPEAMVGFRQSPEDRSAVAMQNQEIVAQQFQRERQQLQMTMSMWQRYGDVAGTVLGGIVTGQKGVGAVFAVVGQQVMGVLREMAIRSIMAHAAGAAAGAAESQAAIPIVGPGLAIAAMTAVFAAVQALLGQIGSAEGGWALPFTGGPFPSVLHRGEIVNNRYDSAALKRLDAMAESGELGGGGRGGDVHLHIDGAMDAKSFEGWWERRGETLVVRGLAKARRNGRF